MPDQSRNDRAQGLRQQNMQRRLPSRQAHGLCRFRLATVDRLQAAAHIFRQVGGAKHGNPHPGADCVLDGGQGRVNQRHHEHGQEEHGDQRNTAYYLDIEDAGVLHHGQIAAPPQGQREADGEGCADAKDRQLHGQHQAAPDALVRERQQFLRRGLQNALGVQAGDQARQEEQSRQPSSGRRQHALDRVALEHGAAFDVAQLLRFGLRIFAALECQRARRQPDQEIQGRPAINHGPGLHPQKCEQE